MPMYTPCIGTLKTTPLLVISRTPTIRSTTRNSRQLPCTQKSASRLWVLLSVARRVQPAAKSQPGETTGKIKRHRHRYNTPHPSSTAEGSTRTGLVRGRYALRLSNPKPAATTVSTSTRATSKHLCGGRRPGSKSRAYQDQHQDQGAVYRRRQRSATADHSTAQLSSARDSQGTLTSKMRSTAAGTTTDSANTVADHPPASENMPPPCLPRPPPLPPPAAPPPPPQPQPPPLLPPPLLLPLLLPPSLGRSRRSFEKRGHANSSQFSFHRLT